MTKASQTDLQLLTQMLKRAGIKFETEDRYHQELSGGRSHGLALTVEGGYRGFFTVFRFSVGGVLKEIGAYE